MPRKKGSKKTTYEKRGLNFVNRKKNEFKRKYNQIAFRPDRDEIIENIVSDYVSKSRSKYAEDFAKALEDDLKKDFSLWGKRSSELSEDEKRDFKRVQRWKVSNVDKFESYDYSEYIPDEKELPKSGPKESKLSREDGILNIINEQGLNFDNGFNWTQMKTLFTKGQADRTYITTTEGGTGEQGNLQILSPPSDPEGMKDYLNDLMKFYRKRYEDTGESFPSVIKTAGLDESTGENVIIINIFD